ncbi:MAG: manganese efflux pump MntP [Cyanobacterium sp.]
MTLITILLTSFGLAMDAFAVSVCSGLTIKKVQFKDALLIATFFGSFQVFMPIIGWFLGLTFRDFIPGFDNWIAFVLLAIIGIKMIMEGMEEGEEKLDKNPRNLYNLFALAIATSVDSLAVGLSFSLIDSGIVHLLIAVGIITFVLSFAGVILGGRFGHLFEKQAEIIGGIILVLLGLRILFFNS